MLKTVKVVLKKGTNVTKIFYKTATKNLKIYLTVLMK